MKGDIFDLRRLKYFVAIAEAGSLSAAARKLNVAQPALTHQMGVLERCLERPVFIRSSRGIALTAAGSLLLKHAEAVLAQVLIGEEAIRKLDVRADFPDSVSISLGSSIYDMAAALVLRFNATFPDTKITVSEDRFPYFSQLMKAGKLDLAVTRNDPHWPGGIFLGWETLYLVSRRSSPEDTADPIDFRNLATARRLIVGTGGPMRHILDETARQTGTTLPIAQELQGIAARKQAVLDGMGTAILPWRNVARETRAGILLAHEIINPALQWELVMRARPGLHVGFVDQCCAIMRQLLEEAE